MAPRPRHGAGRPGLTRLTAILRQCPNPIRLGLLFLADLVSVPSQRIQLPRSLLLLRTAQQTLRLSQRLRSPLCSLRTLLLAAGSTLLHRIIRLPKPVQRLRHARIRLPVLSLLLSLLLARRSRLLTALRTLRTRLPARLSRTLPTCLPLLTTLLPLLTLLTLLPLCPPCCPCCPC